MKITAEDFQSLVCTFPPYEVIYSRVLKLKFTNDLSELNEILKRHEQILKGLGCVSTSLAVVDATSMSILGRRPATESERDTQEDLERNAKQVKRAKLREDLVRYQKRIEEIKRELRNA